mmetsp:Transcript_41176/g.103481  ORF Transcript_41176/g.103481 Transcript_41176/m.103481 type:complete len:234 (-) Transcript_41176:414-1115(-)
MHNTGWPHSRPAARLDTLLTACVVAEACEATAVATRGQDSLLVCRHAGKASGAPRAGDLGLVLMRQLQDRLEVAQRADPPNELFVQSANLVRVLTEVPNNVIRLLAGREDINISSSLLALAGVLLAGRLNTLLLTKGSLQALLQMRCGVRIVDAFSSLCQLDPAKEGHRHVLRRILLLAVIRLRGPDAVQHAQALCDGLCNLRLAPLQLLLPQAHDLTACLHRAVGVSGEVKV